MKKIVSMLFPNGLDKALTLSYDDGVWQDIKLMEIFDRYGIKGTFNLSSGFYEIVNFRDEQYLRLTHDEAVKVYTGMTHEIAVHGYAHPNLKKMSDEDAIWQITEDRKNLERDYGTTVRGMAYPYGKYNKRIIDITRKCGIVYARTINSTKRFDMPTEWLEWNPTCHHRDPDLMKLAEKFVNNQNVDEAQLFYLWGHSFEFESFHEWDIIETFCKYMGGRDDIWYAANIEICDYTRAYERLEWSADMNKVYNPTAYQIWFRYCVDDKTMIASVASGETTDILL